MTTSLQVGSIFGSSWQTPCKTVGSAYDGSNPSPATTQNPRSRLCGVILGCRLLGRLPTGWGGRQQADSTECLTWSGQRRGPSKLRRTALTGASVVELWLSPIASAGAHGDIRVLTRTLAGQMRATTLAAGAIFKTVGCPACGLVPVQRLGFWRLVWVGGPRTRPLSMSCGCAVASLQLQARQALGNHEFASGAQS